MLNVLLISPRDPLKPSNLHLLMGGENTYTKMLLRYPPRGIRYTYYSDALARGEISYTFWQKLFSLLLGLRILPPDAGYQCLKLNIDFDLIHCHGYCVKLDGKIRAPVILGTSSSNYIFLRDYLNWSKLRIKFQYAVRKSIHKVLHIYDPEFNLLDSYKLIVFSKYAKKIHIEFGTSEKRIQVMYPGLPIHKVRVEKFSKPKIFTILFAGVWFERKGGYILLDAYRVLREKYENIRLVILGVVPKGVVINDATITQHNFVSYKKLFSHYQQSDVLVHVPPLVEGYGMVVPEALSIGLPAIVSDVCALPEFIENRKSGFVIHPGNMQGLVRALELFIRNPTRSFQMRKNAKKRFNKLFDLKKFQTQIAKLYSRASKKPYSDINR